MIFGFLSLAVLLVALFLLNSQDLLELERRIVMTQKEIADGLTAVKTQLTEVSTEVAKVGVETSSLNDKIVALETAVNNQTDASPELAAAFVAVRDQANVVAAGVQAVDALVPDAPVVELPPQ